MDDLNIANYYEISELRKNSFELGVVYEKCGTEALISSKYGIRRTELVIKMKKKTIDEETDRDRVNENWIEEKRQVEKKDNKKRKKFIR